ncbi:MAG: family efflux transporter permease subunit [Thermoleophilia bacterium]|nr:family efflux transporter permease subunit [Thermoleophilia bacterium]
MSTSTTPPAPTTDQVPAANRALLAWTFVVTALALFMVSLDNLVVTTALPVIKDDLGATLEQLEWTVNAYTLTFAVLLLTGAALGDRFGRRRMFALGLGTFTLASAFAAVAPNVGSLIAARALQGAGGAIALPLTLTLLSAVVPPARRGLALGAWGGVGGLAVALGPVVGGAIVEGISWQWIFWLNVPIGLAIVPLALLHLRESHGAERSLDLPGVALASTGLLGVVWGLVRGNAQGWGSAEIIAALVTGAALLVGFVLWELRTAAPMLPMRFFGDRAFAAANVASLALYFGMFGSVFLLTQFFQVVQGLSPLQSGIRILPWTIMPMFVTPIAGALSDRVGGGRIIAVGMALLAAGLAWVAAVTRVDVPYVELVGGFVVSGIGMALFFGPVSNVVLSTVRPSEEGKASGANNAIREVGGVLGVAVLASVFSHVGGYGSPTAFVDGLEAATWIGAGVVGLGAVGALFIPRRQSATLVARPLAPLGLTADDLVAELATGTVAERRAPTPSA